MIAGFGSLYAQENNQVYLGLGMGLDYGGVGAKVEYLPVKNVGVFAGLGFNLLSVGWNVGATYKIMSDKKVSINPMVFYGKIFYFSTNTAVIQPHSQS